MCDCKYHRTYECKKGCNPELVKLSLSGEIVDKKVVFNVKNESTVTLRESVIICSKELGIYKKSLCDTPMFPGETITITADLPNFTYEDKAMAFVKVGDKEYVVSKEVDLKNKTSWRYIKGFRGGAVTRLFVGNDPNSNSAAENVTFVFMKNNTGSLISTDADEVIVDDRTVTVKVKRLEVGDVRTVELTSMNIFVQTCKITSDTPLQEGYSGISSLLYN